MKKLLLTLFLSTAVFAGISITPGGSSGGGSGASAWGDITGTLSSQTDLQSALDAKQSTTLSNGKILVGNGSNAATAVTPTGDVTISNAGVTAIGATKVTNAMLAGSIAYSKLALTGSILNADLAGSIAYSKLALTGSILNADLAGSIAAAKLVGSDIATVGTITSGTWSATAIANSKGGTGGDSSASTGLAHVAAGTWSYSSLVNADVSASAAIDFSKLASLTSAHILVGSSGNVATDVAVTGDISITNAGVTAYSGTVGVSKGGTGLTTLTTGNVILGAGSSTPTFVAPGTSGNVLTSNGSTWVSSAPAGGIGGSTGATDNRILRSDGTGGATLQNSLIAIDDAGRLSVSTSGNIAGDVYNQQNTYTGNATAGSAFGVYTYMVASASANQDFTVGGSWGNVTLVDGNNNDTASKGAGGAMGWARGGNFITGLAGIAYSGRGTNARLIGVYGHGGTDVLGGGATLGTSVGGYFDTGTGGGTFPASGILSALVANNLATTNDIFEGMDNGTVAFAIKDGGIVQMGATSTTPKHIINSDTYTNGADALTLANGPTGKAGDPAGYLKITVNGTDRAIPFW